MRDIFPLEVGKENLVGGGEDLVGRGERTMRLWWRRERGPLSIGRVEGENHVAFQSGDPVVAAELMVPGA